MRQSLLASGYEALDLIGEGAYGVVWHVLRHLLYPLSSPAHLLLHSQLGFAHTYPTQSGYQTHHTFRPHYVLP